MKSSIGNENHTLRNEHGTIPSEKHNSVMSLITIFIITGSIIFPQEPQKKEENSVKMEGMITTMAVDFGAEYATDLFSIQYIIPTTRE